MNKLSLEDVEAAMRHEDKRGRASHVYKQLADTMRQIEEMQLCHKEVLDKVLRENERLKRLNATWCKMLEELGVSFSTPD